MEIHDRTLSGNLVTGGRLDRSQTGKVDSFCRAPDRGVPRDMDARYRDADLSGQDMMVPCCEPERIGGASLGPLFLSAVTGGGAAAYCLWSGYGLVAALGVYVATGVGVFLVSALAIFAVVTARSGKCD